MFLSLTLKTFPSFERVYKIHPRIIHGDGENSSAIIILLLHFLLRLKKKKETKNNTTAFLLFPFYFNAKYVGQKTNRFRHNNKSSSTEPETSPERHTWRRIVRSLRPGGAEIHLFPNSYNFSFLSFFFVRSRLFSWTLSSDSARRNITGCRLWRLVVLDFSRAVSARRRNRSLY